MLKTSMLRFYWTVNANPVLGYNPGELVCFDYQAGGGFAGAPQVLFVGLASGISPSSDVKPKPAEWPMPNVSIEYRIGGRQFQGYHYRNPNRVQT